MRSEREKEDKMMRKKVISKEMYGRRRKYCVRVNDKKKWGETEREL